MTQQFRSVRRQQFVTESFFKATDANYSYLLSALKQQLSGPTDGETMALQNSSLAKLAFEQLILRFTAGGAISVMRAEFGAVVESYVLYQRALESFENIPQIAPLGFESIVEYECAMQLTSLCYLLHRRDLLPKLRALFDPAYGGEDTVYEDLMAFDVEGRMDVDKWYHAVPYTALVNAMYLDMPEAKAELKRYCDIWYKAFEGAPWHNGHLRIDGAEGDYFGYWAFEAGAVSFLYEIDDAEIEHMVYPRDLVNWAREHKDLSEEDDRGTVRLRCLGGDSCPREGYWFTPARVNSRRQFRVGDIMPTVGGDYGVTIWQWDELQ